MSGVLQFVGMAFRGWLLLSIMGLFIHCLLNGANAVDVIIFLAGFSFAFADTIFQVIHIAKGGRKLKTERLYLVDYAFEGGQGVTIIRAKGVSEGEQDQVYSVFLENVQQRNPELNGIVLRSIMEVPGK